MRIIYRMRGNDNFFDQYKENKHRLIDSRKDNISLVVVYFELLSILEQQFSTTFVLQLRFLVFYSRFVGRRNRGVCGES